ncbi:PREDICTED: dr1-associated corepressor-like [Camelina sativa]|uniref:Dr1-associated corepressor-like n=1 Tax=Camelina sativa TaxID=90675 RepID=A0ABM0YCR1_CAMSA|nr:PREDICTED: dr1-associated corepressor-like [Camelina sativa]
MRKKLDTRFPAARIKKIMQADEDVGKIALAVPVLVSKSLELFLQDLCDRTYEITLERGAKTVSSLHLKHCVERYNVFDFLREVVSKVPDYGHSQGQGHGDVTMDDRSISKRRKPITDEVNDSDEEYKKSKTQETGNAKPSGRGGRGRGRGRGRGGRAAEREGLNREMELETVTAGQPPPDDSMHPSESSPQENEKKDVDVSAASNEDTKQHLQSPKEGIHFDLNSESLDLNETRLAPATGTTSSVATAPEEYSGWPMMDIGKLDPAQLASLGKRIDEDEEDYDEEG